MMIIKVGGGNGINLEAVAHDLAALRQEEHESFILVHGANALRDSLAERLQKKQKIVTSISGYTSVLSDQDTIDLLMMAYAGLRNKRIVELLQQKGVAAVGLCGVDGGVIRAKRNNGIRVQENSKIKLLRDLSGKPASINKSLLDLLLENNYIPVLTVPILDENHQAVNSENDDITAILQREYRAERVIHLVEAPGLLANPQDPASLLERLTPLELSRWETIAQGRIKRKLLAIKRLFENGVEEVFLSDGRVEHPIKNALSGKGTVIR